MALTDIPSFREVLSFEPLGDNEICRQEWFGVVFRKENVKSCQEALRLAYSIQNSFPQMSQRIAKLGDDFSTERQARDYMRVLDH